MMHRGYNPLRVMEDLNENNDIVELFEEDIMGTDIDEEVEPKSASPEITARRQELLVELSSLCHFEGLLGGLDFAGPQKQEG
jgi:hypothetical protein